MGNIKEIIEERLWEVIKRNYNADNYKNAILDSIQFIGDIIRDKSGLDSDGNNLIGSAFGGENPKIKLNKLKTESDKNIQKGVESILRGIYSAYRNPRSHSKTEDSETDAFEIIVFLNHLLKLIDKSTGRFTVELFLKRVFDEDFVQSKVYSDLLIKEIPPNKYFEIAIEIFNAKDSGKIHNLKLVWDSINLKLSDEEGQELINLASEELRYTESIKTVIRCIALFKTDWEKIDEDSRLRAENKLIQNLNKAEKSNTGQLNEFAVNATWIPPIFSKCSLKDDIAQKLHRAIESGNEDRQRFVVEHFSYYLDELNELLLLTSYKEAFIDQLSFGNRYIYNYLVKFPDDKILPYKEALEKFIPAEIEDDLPF